MSTAPNHAELLATLDALRKQVKRGEIECVAIVAISPTAIVQPVIVGEPQTVECILAVGLALQSHCNTIACAALEDEADEEMPDAFADSGDERAN
jgi:hypothetical protein